MGSLRWAKHSLFLWCAWKAFSNWGLRYILRARIKQFLVAIYAHWSPFSCWTSAHAHTICFSSICLVILFFFGLSCGLKNVYNRNDIARHTAAKKVFRKPFDQRMSIYLFFHSSANRQEHLYQKLQQGKCLFEWKLCEQTILSISDGNEHRCRYI